MRETELIDKVAALFADLGHETAREVPFFERKVDLVAVHPRERLVTIVEGKLHDWHKGIAQILLAQSGAHQAFLAVTQQTATRVPSSVLRQYGIGLIEVDGAAHVAQHPSRLSGTNRHCVAMLLAALDIGKE